MGDGFDNNSESREGRCWIETSVRLIAIRSGIGVDFRKKTRQTAIRFTRGTGGWRWLSLAVLAVCAAGRIARRRSGESWGHPLARFCAATSAEIGLDPVGASI
jgi:hypothetical protein